MKNSIYFFAICVLTFSIIGNVNAQVPQTISYQGLLTTSSGAPIADGNYNLTFSLYTVPTGGTPIWTETQSSVPVSKGTFSVILGSVTPFTGVNFAQQLYLGITKDSDPEFSPRSALTSAPSSLAPWAIRGSNISYMNGNVGIGTTTPNEKLEITGNLRLPASTASVGVIKSEGSRFIHNYGNNNFFAGVNAGNLTMTGLGGNTGVGVRALFSNTTGYWNTANGYEALFDNTTGRSNTASGYGALSSNTTGDQNTANGVYALRSNTTGFYNTANGYGALFDNTTGQSNTASGYAALSSNTTGYWNTANGMDALYSNVAGSGATAVGYGAMKYANNTATPFTNSNVAVGYEALRGSTTPSANTGNSNTAIGYQALFPNTTGSLNSANGFNALFFNTTGSYNTANGARALFSNTTGSRNTANGHATLYSNTTGSYNTALGYGAGYNITTGSNNIAIGYNAQVPTGTADNQIRLGNTDITYAGIQVAWTVTSDRRYKENIQPLNLGLGFISKLNPVSYHRKADEKQRTEYGLIAQEVEQVLKDCGVEKPGMLTITDEGMYELRYNDLLAPMIKAIQELGTENKELKTKNQELAERLSTLEAMVKSLVEKQSTETKSLGEVRMTKDQ